VLDVLVEVVEVVGDAQLCIQGFVGGEILWLADAVLASELSKLLALSVKATSLLEEVAVLLLSSSHSEALLLDHSASSSCDIHRHHVMCMRTMMA
jgi:hypothetical protein